MQIIIPMSGFGERFRRAGYQIPKPLIEIEDKPIIAHVIDLFPSETDFIFICNEEHLGEPKYKMREILGRYCSTGTIVAIPPHKLGPVHAVLEVEKYINQNSPVVVNYCDFTCYWDWKHFKSFVKETKSHGSIPAYRGFHPHSLGTTNYAYLQEQNGWVKSIQEKQPYTDNRMEEYASSGTYYYATGKLMLDAFKATIEQDLKTGGEFYASLTYLPLLSKGYNISVYELQHFMQWGTPADVDEYLEWSKTFKALTKPENVNTPRSGSLIIPMAGLGKRFKDAGYETTKPLISVSGEPMVYQAASCLPPAEENVFVLREDMPECEQISTFLENSYDASIATLKKLSQGQADSALFGLLEHEKNNGVQIKAPITLGACDNGVFYNKQTFDDLIANTDVDVIVWGVRRHVNAVRNPHMFGWISATDGKIDKISVKQPLENPETDPIVIGTFTFKYRKDLLACIESMHKREAKVNGEYYLDTCINDAIALGLNCYLFEVDSYISWGTPNDLKTFEYWQSCFHKWPGHPYDLRKDRLIEKASIDPLNQRYSKKTPELIEPATPAPVVLETES